MRNVKIANQTEAPVALLSSSGFNSLPPTGNWADNLLDNFFSDRNDSENALSPFDYEGFLRREGLSW